MPESVIKVPMIINADIEEVIVAKQLDTLTRFLEVTLLDDNGAPLPLMGCTVRFNAEKPGGAKVYNNAKITDAANGVFLVEFTNQILAVPGKVKADISVYSAEELAILTTRIFTIDVQETKRDEDAIISSNEFSALTIALHEVWRFKALTQSISDRIGQSTDGIIGDYKYIANTIFGVINYIANNLGGGGVDIAKILGTSDSAANTTTVMGLLKTISNKSTVKSVQRGVAIADRTTSGSSSSVSSTITITISSVNTSKSLVILNNQLVSSSDSSNGSLVDGAYLRSMTSTSLTIGSHKKNIGAHNYSYEFSWQVIEFN